ncbi:MAG: HpcH/HpaI aldolase/citrate lyase family protein [Micromonosporaceae bacterium]|nr:HpcH/HpaI aldolase/citrate lyase family protein [Micromonosporaceae bacterium]
MRHFAQLDDATLCERFHIPPAEFTVADQADVLAAGLGATLYLPAVRPCLADDLTRCHARGIVSMICCLEDAVRDREVAEAERHLVRQLRQFAAGCASDPRVSGPLLFVRVRTADQIYRIAEGLGQDLGVLCGFVLPKFSVDAESVAGLRAVVEVTEGAGRLAHHLRVMPILESTTVAHLETRSSALLDIRDLLAAHRDRVLAVRVGVTDLSGVFGLRRPATMTAWELSVLAGILADVINVFVRRDGGGFVVVGPVFEYFESRDGGCCGGDALDTLVREVRRDLANGLLGKTIIHPTHADIVHALTVVSHEEYCDATAICLEADGTGGVLRSSYGNKMNEVKPHRAWAAQLLRRAALFGVAAEGVGFVDLIRACDRARGALV